MANFDTATKTLQLRMIRQKVKQIKAKHEEELAPFVEFETR